MLMHKKSSGFTLVELLIVIVVIAILAAISVVAYRGVQDRARDTRRVNDIAQIKKALMSYDVIHGGVVNTAVYRAPGEQLHGGWDMSTRANWLSFLEADNGLMPVDPENIPPPTPTADANDSKSRQYTYFCYSEPSKTYVRLSYYTSKAGRKSESFPVSACLNSIPS